jgi:hypothetical protein
MPVFKIALSLPPKKPLNLKNDISDIDKRMKQLSKVMKKWLVTSAKRQSAKKEYEVLRTRLIDLSFRKKQADPNFEMPEAVQKIYEIAKEITEGGDEKILNHGKEYAFLTSRGHLHYFDKHIKTLKKWGGPKCSKLVIDQEGVKLCTHSGKVRKHLVSDLIEESEKNRDLIFDLTYFDLIRRVKNKAATDFKPAFQTRGDGKYHISVVTDCPGKNLTVNGNHTWLRLTDDKGCVYSVGKFPMDLKLPFLFRKEAVLFSCPDTHEWLCLEDAVEEHRFDITKRDFKILIKNIEYDLQNSPNEDDFNVFGESCSDWAIDQIAKIGLIINKRQARVDQFSVLCPKFGRFYEKYIPLKIRTRYGDHIRKTISIAALQLARIALIFLFGGVEKNQKNKKSKPFIKSPKDLVKPDLTEFIHPFKLRQYLDKQKDLIQKNYWEQAREAHA